MVIEEVAVFGRMNRDELCNEARQLQFCDRILHYNRPQAMNKVKLLQYQRKVLHKRVP